MPETIEIASGGEYILVTSIGPPSLDELEQSFDQLLALFEQTGIKKVLVDSRQRYVAPNPADAYQGGNRLAEMSHLGLRFAVVAARMADGLEFFEDVSVNRGGRIAFFTDIDAARAWLGVDS